MLLGQNQGRYWDTFLGVTGTLFKSIPEGCSGPQKQVLGDPL